MRPYPIYIGRELYWDIELPDGELFGIRFKTYSRAAELLR